MTKNTLFPGINCKPKIVLFDWDNTIVTTKNLFSRVLAITLDELGIAQDLFHTEAFKSTRNMSVRDSFPIIFGDKWETVWKKYKEIYIRLLNEGGVSTFEGIVELLERLHNDDVHLGIVSNKNHDLLLEEIEMVGISHFFKSIVGAGEAVADKPSASHAIHAIDEIIASLQHKKKYDIDMSNECWLVGDSHVDVSCAVNTNCIPVLFGSNTNAEHVLAKQYLLRHKIKHITAENFFILQNLYEDIKNRNYN